ncbi:MAG TPA: hypothetical protein VN916_05550 [Candidatus Acidoferrum sp.]|jgi:hypothetical protein|nr:hypothetical protein [Candidatus Acidoferrum sp.]
MEHEITRETAVAMAQQEAEKATEKLDRLNAETHSEPLMDYKKEWFAKQLAMQFARVMIHRLYVK